MSLFDAQMFGLGLYVMGVLLMLLTEYEFYLIQHNDESPRRRFKMGVRALGWPLVTGYRALEFLGYIWRFNRHDFALSPMEERQAREYRTDGLLDEPTERYQTVEWDEAQQLKAIMTLEELRERALGPTTGPGEVTDEHGGVAFEAWSEDERALDDSGR